jgi:F-type H+-transporting ATPase subunit gamma
MSSSKEIGSKITSVKKTQKITKAMQMVAASKMRKAQQRMEISMPYADKIRTVMGHIAHSNTEYKHALLQPRNELVNIGYIIISTDRGLCGGLNINLFRLLLQEFHEWHAKESHIHLCSFGNKAVSYFRALGFNTLASAQGFGDRPRVKDLIGGVKTMIDAYTQHKLDRIYIAHNVFINKMVQKPRVIQFLPLEVVASDKSKNKTSWDYIYEPSPQKLLDTLISRYLETQVYQAVVDNLACEQAARMLAMKNATESAEELINELKLMYNKTRQAAITREIAEIISGAESV